MSLQFGIARTVVFVVMTAAGFSAWTQSEFSGGKPPRPPALTATQQTCLKGKGYTLDANGFPTGVRPSPTDMQDCGIAMPAPPAGGFKGPPHVQGSGAGTP